MNSFKACSFLVLLFACTQIASVEPRAFWIFDDVASWFAPRADTNVTESPNATTPLPPDSNTTQSANTTLPPVSSTQSVNTTASLNTTQSVNTTLPAGNQTTPAPPPGGDFVCTENGSFPDPDNCSRYHVCIFDPATEKFQDNQLECPGVLIFCPADGVCQFPISCPSNLTCQSNDIIVLEKELLLVALQ